MADKYSGWDVEMDHSIVSETADSIIIRFNVYFRTYGWSYNMSPITAHITYWGADYKLYEGNINIGSHQRRHLGYWDVLCQKGHEGSHLTAIGSIQCNTRYLVQSKRTGEYTVNFNRKDAYDFYFHLNGGVGDDIHMIKFFNEPITIPNVRPHKPNHVFVAWYLNSQGTGGGYDSGITNNDNRPMHFYAKYNPETYRIKYNITDGGMGDIPDTIKTFGQKALITNTKPTKQDYVFKGWAKAPNGEVVYTPNAEIKENEKLTLYSIWELDYINPKITDVRGYRVNKDFKPVDDGNILEVSFDWETYIPVRYIVCMWREKGKTWADYSLNISNQTKRKSYKI